MYGSHLSIAGSLSNALTEAARLRMDCVQVFTKNQRQWRAPPLREEERAAWLDGLNTMGWLHRAWDDVRRGDSRRGRVDDDDVRVVSHNSYLINMASPDPEIWEKSVSLQRIEMERCEALAIPCCVAHPGAHMGAGRSGRPGEQPHRDEVAGLNRIVKALNRLHRELPGCRVITCLETTAGAGSSLGWDFQHLAYLRENIRQPERVGFCFDTCHVTAAGYDMSSNAKAAAVLERFDAACGLEDLRVFHLNDSVGEIGSRRDRHAHIGEGRCGRACFRAIVTDPRFGRVPKILETPKKTHPSGEPWDIVNTRRLKRMRRARRPASAAH